MSSESDDDLLALAGADSDTEDEMPSKRQKTSSGSPESPSSPQKAQGGGDDDDDDDDDDDETERPLPDKMPYPLQGKFKDLDDREYLMGLPELERESILFDRAEEVRNYKERLYLRNRAAAQQPKEITASRSTRVGTSGRLKELRRAREARKQQEADYSESESGDGSSSSGDEAQFSDASDASDSGEPVEWAEQEKADDLTVADINATRWGKTLFQKYCHYPDFQSVIRGCFVRVSVGFDARLQKNSYILGQIVRLEKCEPYVFGDRRRVDEKLVVTYAGSEQAVEMGSCSDSNATQEEFDTWKHEMETKDVSLPSKRRMQQKAKESIAEQTRILTSEEISDMVAKRQSLAGLSGSNVVLQRSVLEEQREAAIDSGDNKLVAEIDAKLEGLSASRRQSRPATTKSALEMLSERNRRSNLQSVRKAEVQAQVERRRSGFALKADPFSRLRTNAKLFYDDKNEAPVAQVEEPEGFNKQKIPLSAIDSMIAKIDIELKIVI